MLLSCVSFVKLWSLFVKKCLKCYSSCVAYFGDNPTRWVFSPSLIPSSSFFFSPTTVFVFALQVRSSDATWSDTRRNLRKDHRWESASLLEREEKEKLFNEHVEALAKKKKEHFRQLLDETSMVRSEKTGQKKVPEVILYAIFIIRYIW